MGGEGAGPVDGAGWGPLEERPDLHTCQRSALLSGLRRGAREVLTVNMLS